LTKILSRAGVSLADTYDVQGSIAGIEELESREVTLVHEMGATIFSERFSSFVRRAIADSVSQSTAFESVLSDLPTIPWKVLGITVWITTTARLDQVSVTVLDPVGGREILIWAWDTTTNDEEITVRLTDLGALGTRIVLRPHTPLGIAPMIVAGNSQPQHLGSVALRGITGAFGAGTVSTIMLMNIGFAQVGGISSKGLPIPSW